jgi:predicted SnoaL-like aldol condensation-catalyzing enzyme
MRSTLSDTDLSRQNKATVQHFHDVVFNQHRASAAVEFIQEDYVQHSPYLADGREPFIDYFGTLFTEYPNSRIDVKRLVAEGDYVVVHSHFTRWPSDRGTAMVDIYRLEGGRLAEHWDVTEDVPERAANRNTMF